MPTTLTPTAEQQTVDFLIENWDLSTVRGFDPSATADTDAARQAYLPIKTSIEYVGAMYPSVVVTASNEPPPSPTGYQFMGTDGPGATPQGEVVATVRAESRESDTYVGDDGTYSGTDAESIVEELAAHIDELVHGSAYNPGTDGQPDETDFIYWSSYPANPPADDRGEGDTVFLAQRAISYAYEKTPP